MQCGKFLANHPDLKAVEAEDTAGSAAYIAKHHVRGWAAICSSYAAQMYGMKVLQEGIHDNPHNFDNLTRYRQSIDAITPLVKKIKVLGEYEEKE